MSEDRPGLPLETYVARRRRIADQLGSGHALVVATHAEALHSNDVHHRFRPQNDFWYLTGFGEPHSVLVLHGGSAETHLFLDERDPKQEIWTGRRLGLDRAKDALEVDHVHAIDDLPNRLADTVGNQEVRTIARHDPAMQELIANALGATDDGRPLLAEARCIKDADEIALMQRAADAAMEGHLAAFPHMKAGKNERHAEAAFLKAIRDAGSEGPGYPPIVGAGANAAVLHYIENNAPIHSGDLVLMDAGAEWGYYNSDITRTVPADGEWTGRQKDLYAVVLAAQDAAIRATRPGKRFRDPHDAAVQVLTEGLVELGLLDMDVDQALEKHAQQDFYMHGTSHYLGLDVHDPGRVKDDEGESRPLEVGMALTAEPGLYFNPDFAALPPGLDPLGIRIENDLVVTEDGCLDLTRALPRDPDALAALVSSN